jgi:hypothetical protein
MMLNGVSDFVGLRRRANDGYICLAAWVAASSIVLRTRERAARDKLRARSRRVDDGVALQRLTLPLCTRTADPDSGVNNTVVGAEYLGWRDCVGRNSEFLAT